LSLSMWVRSPAARLPRRSRASLMLTASHQMCPGIQRWELSVKAPKVVPVKALAAMRSSLSSTPAQGAARPSGGVGTVWPQSSRGSTYVLHSRRACLGEGLRLWATALICWAFVEACFLRFPQPGWGPFSERAYRRYVISAARSRNRCPTVGCSSCCSSVHRASLWLSRRPINCGTCWDGPPAAGDLFP